MLNSSRDRERRTGIIRKARQRENTCGAKTATHKNQNITGNIVKNLMPDKAKQTNQSWYV